MLHRISLLSLLVTLTALTVPGDVAAQAPTVRAYVAPDGPVGVGRSFTLNVEISGTQQIEAEPTLPDLSSFAQSLGSSRQSSVQMVNGRTRVSVTLQYRYQALVEGSHTIPSFEVEAGGQRLATDPVQLRITTQAAGAPTDPASGVISSDDLFITAEPSKRVVYEGEPLILEYRIWTRVDVTRFGMTTVPEPEGFWVEDVTQPGQPRIEERTWDGVQYTSAVIRRIALVPTGAGERTVEPIGVEAEVRLRAGGDPFEDFFGRSSIFGTRSVPTTVLANSVTIDVRPLPPGAPDVTYSGMVGDLEVSASLDRDSIASNEAVTLTVTARGTGNVRAIPEPELNLPADFEVFPPEVDESLRPQGGGLAGTKTFEFVLIPRAPGLREIPAVRYSWFDEAEARYRTASTAPLTVAVSGSAEAEGPGSLGRSGVAELRRDIRYIHLGPLDLRRSSGSLFDTPGFWLFVLLPLAGIGGALTFRHHQDRLEGDVAYARGRRAGRVARKRLSRARDALGADDHRTFYAEVALALRGLVADRLNLAEAGLQTAELDEALARSDIDDDLRSRFVDCLEECDRQRFAPPSAEGEARARFLERAAEVMTDLDRAVR